MKKIIKKILTITKLATFEDSEKPFETSEQYWIERYESGGNSGAGSYGHFAEFKAEIINSFVIKNRITRVMDLGCGDGNQLTYFDFETYIGYDVSPKAIAICKERFKNDPSKQFRLLEDHRNEKAELTLSLDVIFHLIDDVAYESYMKKLFNSSNRFVISPLASTKAGENLNFLIMVATQACSF